MASGIFIFPNKAKLNFFSPTGLLAATAANFRIALIGSGWTPNNSTHEVFADASASEIANGNGYVTGGGALSSVALTETAGVIKFTSSPFVWTASGGNIPAFRRGLVYYLGTLNSKVNPIVGHFLGDSGGSDVPATVDGTTLTFTPNASGILSAT